MEDLNRYVTEKQSWLISMVDKAYETKQITETYLEWVKEQRFEGTTQEEAFDYFTAQFNEIQDQIINYERNRILERLVKGAEMIENETDPAKRRQYLAVYDSLLQKLEQIKQGKEAQAA